jgi:hypothetical protein
VKATPVIPCVCGFFLFSLRNTNKLSCAVAVERLLLSVSFIFIKIKIFSFYLFQHELNSNLLPFHFKGEFPEPPSKPNRSSGCELHPSLKAMVRAQPFSGLENENACHHLREFEEMCSCLSISA